MKEGVLEVETMEQLLNCNKHQKITRFVEEIRPSDSDYLSVLKDLNIGGVI